MLKNFVNKQTNRIIMYLLPSIGNIMWIITFLVVLQMGRHMMNGDGDLGFHITLGRYILASRKIPTNDLFSHTLAGQPVIEHEWLSGVIFAIVEKFYGLNGIILLCALIIATTFWLVYKIVRKESNTLIIPILVTTIAVETSMVHWVARPHVFTFLIFTLWTIVLTKIHKGALKYWLVLPSLMLIWANLHGVFIVGIVTWFIYGFGIAWDNYWSPTPENKDLPVNFWRFFILGGATSFAASLINPYGIGLWKMIFSHIGNRFLTDNTQEFMSPNFHNSDFWPFMIYVGLLIAVLGLTKIKWNAGLLFHAALWLLLGLYGARNVPLFGIAAAPILAEGLNDLFSMFILKSKVFKKINDVDNRIQKNDKLLKGSVWPISTIILVVIGLLLGYKFDAERLGYGFDPQVFPVKAVNWLEQNPQSGEMFNTFKWGGYLQYRLWPEEQVFIDSKSHFYGEDFVRTYLKIINAEDGWEELLDQYNVSWAILPPDAHVVSDLQIELGWKVIYEDQTAVILRKD